VRDHPLDCAHDDMLGPVPAAVIGRVLTQRLRPGHRAG
jgi:hypothetical protein